MAILMNWNTSDKELEMMVNSWKAAQTFISTFPNMWYAFVHTYSYGWRETCWELKLISSLYCALSKIFLVCIYLHELDSKFQNNHHYGYKAVKALCITWWNNFAAVKSVKLLEEEFERHQR